MIILPSFTGVRYRYDYAYSEPAIMQFLLCATLMVNLHAEANGSNIQNAIFVTLHGLVAFCIWVFTVGF